MITQLCVRGLLHVRCSSCAESVKGRVGHLRALKLILDTAPTVHVSRSSLMQCNVPRETDAWWAPLLLKILLLHKYSLAGPLVSVCASSVCIPSSACFQPFCQHPQYLGRSPHVLHDVRYQQILRTQSHLQAPATD